MPLTFGTAVAILVLMVRFGMKQAHAASSGWFLRIAGDNGGPGGPRRCTSWGQSLCDVSLMV